MIRSASAAAAAAANKLNFYEQFSLFVLKFMDVESHVTYS